MDENEKMAGLKEEKVEKNDQSANTLKKWARNLYFSDETDVLWKQRIERRSIENKFAYEAWRVDMKDEGKRCNVG